MPQESPEVAMTPDRTPRRRAAILGLALLVGTAVACGGRHDAPEPDGPGEGTARRTGTHGGRLLESGDFALEVSVHERGAPPRFRLYPSAGGTPIPPAEVSATVTLERLGGRSEVIRFTPEGDHLLGDAGVAEPHAFDVAVEATWQGTTHRWSYEQIEGRIVMPDAALASAGIEVTAAGPMVLKPVLELPGQVSLNQDRVAQVVPRLAGVAFEVRANVGDRVPAGGVMAAIDSRELAEAKNEYIESVHRLEFAQATYVREERLWKRRISPESDLLLAKHKLEEAEIARQIAEQKLVALGIDRPTLAALAIEPTGSVVDRRVRAPFAAGMLTRHEGKAPLAGEVSEKHVKRGEPGQAQLPNSVGDD